MLAAETVTARSLPVLPFKPTYSILGAGKSPEAALTVTHAMLDVFAPTLMATGYSPGVAFSGIWNYRVPLAPVFMVVSLAVPAPHTTLAPAVSPSTANICRG